MTSSCITTLPPTGASAGAARRIVEAALDGSGLEAWLDEALLLVTEVVTNAIVHAGTELDLHLDVGDDRLRVEVVDRSPGALHIAAHLPAETSEGGRGLVLLDALAPEWGIRHFAGGKSVWFVLGDGIVEQQMSRESAASRPGRSDSSTRRDLAWLVELPADLEHRLTPRQLVEELLHRLAAGLDLRQAWVYAQASDDERGWELVAGTDPNTFAPEVAMVHRIAVGVGDDAELAPLPSSTSRLVALRGHGGIIGALVLDGERVLAGEDVVLARLVALRIGVALRDDLARGTQLRSRGSLALLAEASEMFAGTLDVQLGMTLATQLVVPRFARWSAIWDTRERVPRLVAVAHTDEARLPVLQRVLSGHDGELLALRLAEHLDQRRPNLLPASQLPPELDEERPGEVLALPLVARRRLLGVLLLGRPAGAIFGADDVGLLTDLARRTAVAVDSARLYEESTAIARALQSWLLPASLPSSKVVEFAARYAPAGEGNEVGGDFYDVFRLTDDGWGIAIGDVCGKGAEAAAITGMARDVLRLLVLDGARPPAALRRLNDALLELGDRGRFCTATLAIAQPDGDQLRIALSCAGHPQPALVRADGTVSLVGSSGTLLGVLDELDLVEDYVTLGPGDALVFYTDGVTERRHRGVMFGEQNLLGCLHQAAGMPANAIADLVESAVQQFGVARDDLAVLVVRCADELSPR